jgi:DNA polymerase III alpha subunit
LPRWITQRDRGEFASLEDFCQRVGASGEELEALARVGAFDGFGRSRTEEFWGIQHLVGSNRYGEQT